MTVLFVSACSFEAFAAISGLALEPTSAKFYQASTDKPEISVRLRSLGSLISVSGQSLALYSFGSKERIFESQGFQNWQLRFETLQGDPTWSVVDRSSGRSLARIQGRFVELRGDDVRVDLRPAPSHLRLVSTKTKALFELQLVGLLSLDDYVHGVVSAEVPKNWPIEALKAQAVAARSYALAKLRQRSSLERGWMLEASIMDQVFDHEKKHDLAEAAVLATHGEVLFGRHGVAVAHYHADCGGHTDEPREVWGGGEALGTASDGCSMRVTSSWKWLTDLSDVTKKLKANGAIKFEENISKVSVVSRTEGGRAKIIRLVTSSGEVANVTGEKLRAALGYMNLRSTKFEAKISGGRAEFLGRGFGHGSGLCQWGARSLASKGLDYRSILHHYYPKLKLQSLRQQPDLLAVR
jgi:stage II sporulation protein D